MVTRSTIAIFNTRRIGYFAGGDSADGSGAVTSPQPPAVVAFIPPKFPTAGAHDDGLIKPSQYLKSIGGAADPCCTPGEQSAVRCANTTQQTPLHRTKSELSVAVQHQQQHQQQPLAAISIHDLNSVQLKKTPGTIKIMQATNIDKKSGNYLSYINVLFKYNIITDIHNSHVPENEPGSQDFITRIGNLLNRRFPSLRSQTLIVFTHFLLGGNLQFLLIFGSSFCYFQQSLFDNRCYINNIQAFLFSIQIDFEHTVICKMLVYTVTSQCPMKTPL